MTTFKQRILKLAVKATVRIEGYPEEECEVIYLDDALDLANLMDTAVEHPDKTDWSDFRCEAAKDILCAIITDAAGVNPEHITMAIEITDALIDALKGEKK